MDNLWITEYIGFRLYHAREMARGYATPPAPVIYVIGTPRKIYIIFSHTQLNYTRPLPSPFALYTPHTPSKYLSTPHIIPVDNLWISIITFLQEDNSILPLFDTPTIICHTYTIKILLCQKKKDSHSRARKNSKEII